MHVTPMSLKFVGENPEPQSLVINGLSDTQAWMAKTTAGITANPYGGVQNHPCVVSVPSLPIGSSGKVTISAPGHADVDVTVEHVA
jgi:hypothetical protein